MNVRMLRVSCIGVNCPEQANPETEQVRLVRGAGGKGKRMLATITRFLFFFFFGKKWIHSDSERSMLYRVGHRRGQGPTKFLSMVMKMF